MRPIVEDEGRKVMLWLNAWTRDVVLVEWTRGVDGGRGHLSAVLEIPVLEGLRESGHGL